ncbi:MAG: hypothetical protein RR348_01250 [Clostridia bacterium]
MEEEKRKFTEEEVEEMALNTRVINEASDGKVSDFAFELSKEIFRGNLTGDECVEKILLHYGYTKR